jgi:hypothetical protein
MKTRKQLLEARADRYAMKRDMYYNTGDEDWLAGYKAAMRDARKAMHDAQAVELRRPGNSSASVQHVGYAALWRWLRPLR